MNHYQIKKEMKRNLTLSGACLGAMVLVTILGAKPQSASAQDKQEIKKTIIIKNGDTIINGKNLKEASKSERKKLLKEFDGAKQIELHHEMRPSRTPGAPGEAQVIIRKKVDGQPEEVIVRRMKSPNTMVWKDGEGPAHFKMDVDSFMVRFDGDSAMKQMHVRMAGLDSNMRRHFRMMESDGNFEFFASPDGPMAAPYAPEGMSRMMRTPGPGAAFRMERPEGKNSQAFSYSNTDKDGISNRLHIRLNDANKEVLLKISGTETPKTDLMVEDLSFFPSFSTGKLNLAFSLKTKGAVEVKILNSDFQPVFTDKPAGFNESYHKSFSLPKNGVYYLSISQNGQWFIKKVIKE